MKYIGVRSCKGKAEEDIEYTNSSRHIPDSLRATGIKTILNIFYTRELALAEEIRLHHLYNVQDHPDYYNRSNQKSIGFTLSKASIEKANEKRRQYRGINQTEAQRLGNIRMGLAQRGTKNPAKGSLGASNTGFNPWYYITPNNDYIEILDISKQEYAKNFNVTARQLGNRFHHTNIYKRADSHDGRIPEGLRGYVFGNLQTGED